MLENETLSNLWHNVTYTPLEWDHTSSSLRLAREVPLFRQFSNETPQPLALNTRRGAAQDLAGNWYWIDQDESGIRCLPNGATASFQFWTSAEHNEERIASNQATFMSCQPPQPASLLLRSLAITAQRYLVVGNVTGHGLLIFDLQSGNPPFPLRWPDTTEFTPWDLAATPEGGVLVLDRDHQMYWILDEHFRLLADAISPQMSSFQAVDPGSRVAYIAPLYGGYALTGGPRVPVSIEPGPHGHTLILDADISLGYSVIYEYQGAEQVAMYSLQDAVVAQDPALGEGIAARFSVLGHDFAYIESDVNMLSSGGQIRERGCDCQSAISLSDIRHILYVADQGGKQAFAFVLDRTDTKLIDQGDFLPLRSWNGKAIVASNGQVYYDFAERWVPIHTYTECHYAGLAILTTPLHFATDTATSGEPFDSTIPGCTWHRLFLDAQIPQGTSIRVRARAADDPVLLLQAGWNQQPDPYLRSGGAELPYYDPWSDMQPVAERTGTWELLFQEIYGRYLQIELTLQGTGRSTPAIRALRAWYPRFSYLDHYMPAVYRENPVSASFLEHWLANFEGIYTNLEDKIEQAAVLFDPRTTPSDTLDWLAGWFDLVLDPLWSEQRRRFLVQHVDKLYRWRGTVPGVEIAVRLYLDERIDESLFDFAGPNRGNVRIVEHFLARDVGNLVASFSEERRQPSAPLTAEVVQEYAHRFSLFLPHNLHEEQLALVRRIVALEKPAHTKFELEPYGDLFRIGKVRLGVDTYLGESLRFTPLQLGSAYLGDNYLAIPSSFDLIERLVLLQKDQNSGPVSNPNAGTIERVP
ncbi:phage tail protein [Dictyobacter formicarum]|uniref:Phage tail protein n=1 Tax=Dictyobacter formicarum TaxID=2778368 RepID=A0ABQ3VN14_9CHLR|nr:phage tail protein [Dictyobacter formicarum]GHO87620.1 hypothetical protein KSZ_56260 [Dictyobacter formicarum]